MCRDDKLSHLHVTIVLKSGSLNLLEPSGPVQACTGIAFCCRTKAEQGQSFGFCVINRIKFLFLMNFIVL